MKAGESDTIRLQTTLRRRDVVPRGSFIYGGLARPRYRAKLAQSLITAGRILTVNTVATAYNPKTHSRQRDVPDSGPSASPPPVSLRYANTGKVIGVRRSNKHAHPPRRAKEKESAHEREREKERGRKRTKTNDGKRESEIS